METEQDLKQFENEYQEKMKSDKPEEKAKFKMPEKESKEYKIINYNAQNESRNLGKDIFFKLNPEYSGKGHVLANIDENNILSIETFKPETQTQPEQGGFETREKPLGFIEISKNIDSDSLTAQNEKYFDTMDKLIKKYEKSVQENTNPKQELQLNQLKKQLEAYGRAMLGYRDTDSAKEGKDTGRKYEIGIKSLIATGSKNELAAFYYHKLNSAEEVDFVEQKFKECGIKNIEQYLTQEESIKEEILKEDIDILKKTKEKITREDIGKLIIDSGSYITHATNHTEEIFKNNCLLSAYAINARAGRELDTHISENYPEQGINFDKNNIYQGDLFFKKEKQPIAFVSSRGLLTSHMREANSHEQMGHAEVSYIGESDDYNDKSHELDVNLGLFFIPKDKMVKLNGEVVGWTQEKIDELKQQVETNKFGIQNPQEVKKIYEYVKNNIITTQEYWDQYFTNLVKEGGRMPDVNKIVFYKGKLNEAVFDHFRKKGMPSSPRSREKYNNLLVREADKIRKQRGQK